MLKQNFRFRMDWLMFILTLMVSTTILSLVPKKYALSYYKYRTSQIIYLNDHPNRKILSAAITGLLFAFTAGLRRKRVQVPDSVIIKRFELKMIELEIDPNSPTGNMFRDVYLHGVDQEKYVFNRWWRW